jgi:hypothetical protein
MKGLNKKKVEWKKIKGQKNNNIVKHCYNL